MPRPSRPWFGATFSRPTTSPIGCSGNRQDAEDLVQEAFLTALANLRSFDRSRPFGPWFYRIVWTRGLNLRKSLARRAAEPLETERHPGTADPAADAEQGPTWPRRCWERWRSCPSGSG